MWCRKKRTRKKESAGRGACHDQTCHAARFPGRGTGRSGLAREWSSGSIIVATKAYRSFAERCMVAAIPVYQERLRMLGSVGNWLAATLVVLSSETTRASFSKSANGRMRRPASTRSTCTTRQGGWRWCRSAESEWHQAKLKTQEARSLEATTQVSIYAGRGQARDDCDEAVPSKQWRRASERGDARRERCRCPVS